MKNWYTISHYFPRQTVLKALAVCSLATAAPPALHAAANNGKAYTHPVRQDVTGKVTDARTGVPLPGVNIIIKGTTRGTVTNGEGTFTLQANPGDILVLSLIGYTKQELPAKPGAAMNIRLESTATGLDELIVVGYGSQKKKVVTGATVHLNTEDLVKNHSISVEQSLQGQTPGVQVTSNSGQPGDAMKFTIRGIGTNGNSRPLFIVDGFPAEDISYINPSDIAAIDVLKDAASSAIYGTRGANGIVIITTKKGRAGKMSVSFDASYGLQNPARKLDLLNPQQYANMMNEAAINSGSVPIYSADSITRLGKDPDWQKAATNKNAPIQNYSLNLSGGNEHSIFSTSLSYQGQQGVMGLPGRSNFERTSFRINSEHKLYKDLIKTGENLTFAHTRQRGIGTGNIYNNSVRGLLNATPVYPVYKPDGSYGKSPYADEPNPVGMIDYTQNNQTITDRILGNIYAEATLLKGLTLRTDFGADISYNYNNAFVAGYDLGTNNSNFHPSASQGIYRNLTWNWDNYLTYQLNTGKHSINAVVGTTANKFEGYSVNGSKTDLIIADFDHAIIDNGRNDSTRKVFGTRSTNALNSYFARVTYNYDEKYLLTAIIRHDGSTRFGANNRWGNFPSFSAGWIVTNESFLKNNSWIDFLKLRGGWGQNGNDRIDNFAYLATINSTYRDYYFNGQKAIGASPDRIPNPNLRWEASEQIDIGFDATLFRDVTIAFDWYRKNTRNWLVVAPIPDIVGTGAPFINGGNIQNQGIELGINYNHRFGEVTLGIGGNIAFNKNTVLEIPNQEGVLHPSYNGVLSSNMDEYFRAQNGMPIGYFYGLQTAGIFQNQAEIDAYTSKSGQKIQPGAQPGDVRFVDLNGDGVINGDDKTKVGNPNPSHTYGINLSASWRGFDLAILLNGVGGNDIVDGTRAYDRFYNNYTTAVFDRWHGEGTSNYIPRVTQGNEANQNYTRFSDLYVHNGAFLRVKSINFGYDLKKTLMKHVPIQQFRLYISGLNVFTFTHYRGLDPEVGYGIDSWSSGTDLGYFPQPRTILFGLNVKF
ncbi:SusC/RagA family TonB-linked outer membrane protein [Chitinophaga arvensicola]|uniref:TonB-linked outer membrane protein, SusC/RagA family n=1 Tax=Chitinophaga arvensicola TaxID=29529 RepID=A0A1I0RJH2_9BACT|nr:TonB-dependent receptor [Chitinophaga arvensicola]SEW41170.1 TonB-linked outer membrane protein, SusC/RagA family [Chitinophaga arvensicola]